MKVLFFHDDCTAPGGSNHYRKQLSALLRKRGIETSLFTFAVNDSEEEKPFYCYRYSGRLKFLRHIEYFYYNPSLIHALKRWIDFIKPDLIHLHHNYLFPSSALLACRGKAPIIQTIHDFRFLCMIGPKRVNCERCLGAICSQSNNSSFMRPIYYVLREVLPRRFLKQLLKKVIDYYITPTRMLEDSLKTFGVKTFFLPHFVDLSRFRVMPLPGNTNSILFVGYLHFSKGIDTLLRSFSHVIKMIPSATLEIVGDGPYGSTLKELCKSLNLNKRVTFLGAVPSEEVHTFYQRANVVVIPSIVIEVGPLSIYEAMASGRPVVVSRGRGNPDLISDGENGLLFTTGDHEDLSIKILALLLDKGRAETMGLLGRKLAESSFSVDHHIDRYLELVKSLVQSG